MMQVSFCVILLQICVKYPCQRANLNMTLVRWQACMRTSTTLLADTLV